MTVETTVFVLTILLAFGHMLVLATLATSIFGMSKLAGPRDDMPDTDNLFYNRLNRAFENLKETLPWALGLLLLVQITGDANATTAAGAWLYFWSRAAYVPLYLFGIPWLRTLAWGASLVGLAMLLIPVMT